MLGVDSLALGRSAAFQSGSQFYQTLASRGCNFRRGDAPLIFPSLFAEGSCEIVVKLMEKQ